MTVYELSADELSELKQNYLCEHLVETEDRTPSWGELAEADIIVSDETIYEAYANTDFVEDDFWCNQEEYNEP